MREWIAVLISALALLVSVIVAKSSTEDNKHAITISERALQLSSRALRASGPVIAVQCDTTRYKPPPADAIAFSADGITNGVEDDEMVSHPPGDQYQYFACTIGNNGERPATNIRWHFGYALLPWTSDKHASKLKLVSGTFVIRSLAAKSSKSLFLFDASRYSLKYFFDREITFSDVANADDAHETAPVYAWTGFLCPQHNFTVSAPNVKTNTCQRWP